MSLSIAETFEGCRTERRPALVAEMTAGDPDSGRSSELLLSMASGGADLIEVVAPCHGPFAEHPAERRSALRGLKSGMTLSATLDVVARVREQVEQPIVLRTGFNPVLVRGVERFAAQVAASGVDGVLCLDLPVEVVTRRYMRLLRDRGVATVFLVAPTTSRRRLRAVNLLTTGFVHYLMRPNRGGEREAPGGSRSLPREVRRARRRLDHPLVVDWEASRHRELEPRLIRRVDGVAVGAALALRLEETVDDPAAAVEAEVRAFAEALGGSGGRRVPR